MADLRGPFDRSDVRDTLGGAALVVLGLVCLAFAFVAFVAIAYLVMVGPGCPDPWAGCETALGVAG